jgi:hypothetical protein
MRRVLLWLVGLIPVLAAAACGAGAARPAITVNHSGPGRHETAAWRIDVPPGWHAVWFSDSRKGVRSAAVQVSNVGIPAPRLLPPEYSIEVSGRMLTPRGVGLIVATDTARDLPHYKVAGLPLPLPWPDGSHSWVLASSLARSPVYEWMWFRAGGRTYVATATIGWKASRAAQKALDRIVRSIKPAPAPGGAAASRSRPVMPRGTVTGVAAHCAGPVSATNLPVRVTARADGRTVASEVVRYLKDHDRYRLSVPPGRYVISARGSADKGRSVRLHPGERIVVNFPDLCS